MVSRYVSDPVTSRCLVIGTGIAGLQFALLAAENGPVRVVTKKESRESNTNYAQGGIAAAVSPLDDFDTHVHDTLTAGDGLCDEDVVRRMVEAGPELIDRLLSYGVPFSRGEEGEEGFALGREGGHTRRRVLHCKDLTGREIESRLLAACAAHPNIVLRRGPHGVGPDPGRRDGLGGEPGERIVGCLVLDRRTFERRPYLADAVVLATGGCGKVYSYTSNPDIATGDGLAMAYRAGAELRNLEFVQFHPTCLYHPEAKSFLISEAVRGEGAVLVDGRGRPFMGRYHQMADLAPRDVVARSIDREMKTSGEPCACLDLTPSGPRSGRGAFSQPGEDVRPLRHRHGRRAGSGGSGGPLHVRRRGGRSRRPDRVCRACSPSGKWPAPGSTGPTGWPAIRCSRRCFSPPGPPRPAGRAGDLQGDEPDPGPSLGADDQPHGRGPEAMVLEHDWDLVRRVMWDYVGIVRDRERLDIALERLRAIRETVEDIYRRSVINPDVVELRNIALLGELIVMCARARHESRGLHFTLDHPAQTGRGPRYHGAPPGDPGRGIEPGISRRERVSWVRWYRQAFGAHYPAPLRSPGRGRGGPLPRSAAQLAPLTRTEEPRSWTWAAATDGTSDHAESVGPPGGGPGPVVRPLGGGPPAGGRRIARPGPGRHEDAAVPATVVSGRCCPCSRPSDISASRRSQQLVADRWPGVLAAGRPLVPGLFRRRSVAGRTRGRSPAGPSAGGRTPGRRGTRFLRGNRVLKDVTLTAGEGWLGKRRPSGFPRRGFATRKAWRFSPWMNWTRMASVAGLKRVAAAGGYEGRTGDGTGGSWSTARQGKERGLDDQGEPGHSAWPRTTRGGTSTVPGSTGRLSARRHFRSGQGTRWCSPEGRDRRPCSLSELGSRTGPDVDRRPPDRNLASLRRGEADIVVTGQQPGLSGRPPLHAVQGGHGGGTGAPHVPRRDGPPCPCSGAATTTMIWTRPWRRCAGIRRPAVCSTCRPARGASPADNRQPMVGRLGCRDTGRGRGCLAGRSWPGADPPGRRSGRVVGGGRGVELDLVGSAARPWCELLFPADGVVVVSGDDPRLHAAAAPLYRAS